MADTTKAPTKQMPVRPSTSSTTSGSRRSISAGGKVAPKVEPKIDWELKYKETQAKLDNIINEKKKVDTDKFFDKQKESRMVKGVFRFFDNKGGTLKWADRFPWKDAHVKRYKAKDNETIEIPFYVARRLMEKGKVPVFTVTRDSDRRPVQRIKEYRRRFEFFPWDAELQQLMSSDLAYPERPALVTSVG